MWREKGVTEWRKKMFKACGDQLLLSRTEQEFISSLFSKVKIHLEYQE